MSATNPKKNIFENVLQYQEEVYICNTKSKNMKLEITQKGKLIDKSLPKVCTYTYAKKLQKEYKGIGVNTVVLKDSRLRNSAIIDNYFING